jgi:predicted acetyltransferase
MEYHPVPPAHGDAFRRLVTYAFRPETGPSPDVDDDGAAAADPRSFELRGVYDIAAGAEPSPDALVAVCGVYRFETRVRDGWHPLAGVAAVATTPAERRRGHAADLMAGVHRELREDGVPFAALWPFEYRIYRRFGYALANRYAETTLPPGALSALAPAAAGRFRRLTADDWEACAGVHRQWADESLALRRSEELWREHVFANWLADPHVYGWEDDDGDLRGYVVYTVERDGDERTMAVRELAAVDATARNHLFRFCRDHDSQVDRVRLRGPPDIVPPTALEEPGAATVEVKPGPMVRVVDLQAAVGALSFPVGTDGRLAVAVTDRACPWNDGTWELTVADGTGSLRPTDADPDVSTDVGSFSQVLVGAASVGRLAGVDRLAGSETARETLATLCPSTEVFLREYF